MIAYARQKLIEKDLDMIVANDVSRVDAGFDSENSIVSIIRRDVAAPIELPMMSKLETAHRILDEVAKLRHQQAAIRTASTKA